MAKTYKILVNDGKGTDIKPVSVMQGASAKGEPVRMTAKRGWRFELQDDLKGKNLGPDQVRLKRMGKNLGLMFDASVNPDVIIEDFYAENEDKEKDNGSPMIVGQAEDGGMYEYVPQDPAASSMASQLKDGNTPVIVALGGGPLAADFALAGLPLIAAAGGGIGGLLAGGAALVAAAAAGGGGGGGSAGAVPSGQTGHITHDAANDTGVSTSDSYTMNNKPQLTVNAESGATVVVSVNGKDYPATETSTKGVYTASVADVLPDGVYTPVIKVTNGSGSSTANGEAFTVDTSTTKNQDNKKTPTETDDPNSGNAVEVNILTVDDGTSGTDTTIVSRDTGSSNNDFITTDGSLTFKGTVAGLISNGDLVHVQVLNSLNSVLIDQYVTLDSNNAWSINNQANSLAQGNYVIQANIEDKAGNVVKSATQVLTIDSANKLVARGEKLSVNENATITKATKEVGVLANDGDTTAAFVKVVSVGKGTTTTDAVTTTDTTTVTTINGTYGQLDMFSDGHYEYRANVNSLAEGVVGIDKFTYEVQAFSSLAASASLTRPTTTAVLTIEVTGKNDVATVALNNPKPLTSLGEAGDKFNSNGGKDPLSIIDNDDNQASIMGIDESQKTIAHGVYYDLSVEKNRNGSYDWEYNRAGKTPLPANRTVHDLFSFTSFDGTSNATLDLETAVSGSTTQEFNVTPLSDQHSVQGLKATGLTTTTDTLILHGSTASPPVQTTFDFSDSNITTFTSIEKIEIQGDGSNVLKLSLANLTQSDTTGNRSQTLVIDGDSGDTIFFKTAINATNNGTKDISGTTYHSYLFTPTGLGTTDELLVNAHIANITFTS